MVAMIYHTIYSTGVGIWVNESFLEVKTFLVISGTGTVIISQHYKLGLHDDTMVLRSEIDLSWFIQPPNSKKFYKWSTPCFLLIIYRNSLIRCYCLACYYVGTYVHVHVLMYVRMCIRMHVCVVSLNRQLNNALEWIPLNWNKKYVHEIKENRKSYNLKILVLVKKVYISSQVLAWFDLYWNPVQTETPVIFGSCII